MLLVNGPHGANVMQSAAVVPGADPVSVLIKVSKSQRVISFFLHFRCNFKYCQLFNLFEKFDATVISYIF